jgi:flagellar secretion chaperone FliS
MHLQSRLRMDIGGSSARALAEFYAAIFALCIEGSRLASADRLREAIACIRDVREAWRIVALDPEVIRKLQEEQLRNGTGLTASTAPPLAAVSSSNWSA